LRSRRAVVVAGDYVHVKPRFAPFYVHIHRPYLRRCRVGCKVVAAGDYVHIHRPYSRRCRVGCEVAAAASVARSSQARVGCECRRRPIASLTILPRRLRISSIQIIT
jgi:hypothetical protein